LTYTGEPLYTIDQPFFNQQVFFRKTNATDLQLVDIHEETVAFNSIYTKAPRQVFLNFGGQPGFGPIHLGKMVGYQCLCMR
jgi:hypothetical protein